MPIHLHILLSIFDSCLHKLEADNFLRLRAEAYPDGAGAAADIEEYGLFVDGEECLHLPEHFLKNIDIDLKERERTHLEPEAHHFFGIVHRAAGQDCRMANVLPRCPDLMKGARDCIRCTTVEGLVRWWNMPCESS